MKRTLLILSAATFLFTACNNEAKTDTATNNDTANTKTADASKTSSDFEPVNMTEEEMNKKWIENMTPGEMHKVLATYAGTWDCDITHWMKPDTAGIQSKGTSVGKVAFNGLFVESEYKGPMMGMEFVGKETLGYDNGKKKFVSSFHSNMGSGVMVMEGDYDAATKTISFSGNCTNPLNGGSMHIRSNYKIIDDNT